MSDDRRLVRQLDRESRLATRAAQRVARRQAREVVRYERRSRRARRMLPWGAAGTVGAVAGNVVLFGLHGTPLLWVLASVLGLRAAAAARRLLSPPPRPPGPAPLAGGPVPPPPDPRSAAFPAVRRLAQVRERFAQLLPLVAPAGRDSAAEAWRCAREADLALRWQAARIAAVEPIRGVEPDLLAALEAGVQAQEQLLGGLADLVSASTEPAGTGRLTDATDALHALAQGLREVR